MIIYKHKKEIRATKKQRGATMVEYALMVALIAVVAIIGVTALGTAVNNKFTTVAGNINGAG